MIQLSAGGLERLGARPISAGDAQAPSCTSQRELDRVCGGIDEVVGRVHEIDLDVGHVVSICVERRLVRLEQYFRSSASRIDTVDRDLDSTFHSHRLDGSRRPRNAWPHHDHVGEIAQVLGSDLGRVHV